MEPEEIKELFITIPLPKKGNDKQMGTAYHEAGHTRMIWDAKHYDNIDTYLLLEYGIDWTQEEILDYHTCSLMGGIIAEDVYTGVYSWEGANDDFHRIFGIFGDFGFNDIPDLQPYWDKTYVMIQENIQLLERIASDLYEHKTLDEQYFQNLNTEGTVH